MHLPREHTNQSGITAYPLRQSQGRRDGGLRRRASRRPAPKMHPQRPAAAAAPVQSRPRPWYYILARNQNRLTNAAVPSPPRAPVVPPSETFPRGQKSFPNAPPETRPGPVTTAIRRESPHLGVSPHASPITTLPHPHPHPQPQPHPIPPRVPHQILPPDESPLVHLQPPPKRHAKPLWIGRKPAPTTLMNGFGARCPPGLCATAQPNTSTPGASAEKTGPNHQTTNPQDPHRSFPAHPVFLTEPHPRNWKLRLQGRNIPSPTA
jgi:hypothetical protein